MTTVSKADHGRLFDVFQSNARHTHGGQTFDDGFAEQTISEAHGKLYDRFGVPRPGTEHGEHYDEFGWQDMPAVHGQQFDSSFRTPTANTGERGTWFDQFRGGTQVRFMVDGADYEGVVIDVNNEFATVRDHDGQTREVELAQFLAYRTPTEEQASPATPASDAEAPSAHSAARGSDERTAASTEMPPVAETVSPGESTPTTQRQSLSAALPSITERLKALAAEMDVLKADGAFERLVKKLVAEGHTEESARKIAAAAGRKKYGAHAMAEGAAHSEPASNFAGKTVEKTGATCANCERSGKTHPSTKLCAPCHQAYQTGVQDAGAHNRGAKQIASPGFFLEDKQRTAYAKGYADTRKSVDITATAVQGQTNAGIVSKRAGCPRKGASCGAAVDGRCSACNYQVRNHEAVGKEYPHPDALVEVGGNNGREFAQLPSTGKTVSHTPCKDCGKPMNPVDAMVGGAMHGPPICHGCTKARHTAAVHGKPYTPKIHKTVGKTDSDGTGLTERAHATTDHHDDGKRRTCPHCGEVLPEIDHQTEQGAPSRKDKTGAEAEFDTVSHKCLAGSLDILKVALA